MKKIKNLITIFVVSLFIPAYCLAATSVTITVTATVMAGESSISVDRNLIDFGGVSGSVSNRRFVAGPVKVTYFAAMRPWTIRVWTNNNPSASRIEAPSYAGLKGADGTTYMPLKVWDDNFGPIANRPGTPPNEENTYFWRGYDFNGINGIESTPITGGPDISEIGLGFDVNGDTDTFDVITPNPTRVSTTKYPVPEEPVWLRVPEHNEMVPGNPFTWRRLLTQQWLEGPGSGEGGGAGGDPNTFPVFFGIDVTGMSPQEYRTTTLTFQIIGE